VLSLSVVFTLHGLGEKECSEKRRRRRRRGDEAWTDRHAHA
jgi:hypothetical protein